MLKCNKIWCFTQNFTHTNKTSGIGICAMWFCFALLFFCLKSVFTCVCISKQL